VFPEDYRELGEDYFDQKNLSNGLKFKMLPSGSKQAIVVEGLSLPGRPAAGQTFNI
jgi:hypothetical protein